MSKKIETTVGVDLENEMLSEHIWQRAIATKITQVYSEFSVRMQLVNAMAMDNKESWHNYFKTKDGWCGNCVLGPDCIVPNYMRLNGLGLQLMIGQVFTSQQYRSQATHDNVKRELSPSNNTDDQKLKIFHKMEQLNLQCRTSEEFLQAVSDFIIELVEDKEIDIWNLGKAVSKQLTREEKEEVSRQRPDEEVSGFEQELNNILEGR